MLIFHGSDEVQLGIHATQAVPDGLGRGLLSTTDNLRGQVATIDGAEWEAAYQIYEKLAFIDDRSSLASSLTASASAKFSYGAGNASGSVHYSRSYRQSMRRVDLVLTKSVLTRKCFVRTAAMTPQAQQDHAEIRDEFLRRYGDSYVRSVFLGGSMSVVYTFEFEDAKEARDFRVSVKAKYGSAKGSVSLHQSLLKEASKSTIMLEAFACGVRNAPAVLQDEPNVNEKTGRVPGRDSNATLLIEYFNQFEDNVSDDTAVAVAWETRDLAQLGGAPPNLADGQLYRNLIMDAIELDDLIDERSMQLQYMRDDAMTWNPSVNIDAVRARLARLEEMRTQLAEAVRPILELDPAATQLPFERSAVPEIPAGWVARPLEQIGTKRLAFANSRRTVSIPLPSLESGRVVLVQYDIRQTRRGPMNIPGGPGRMIIRWVDRAGASLETVYHDRNIQELRGQRYANSQYLAPPPNAVAIGMFLEVYNGIPFESNLTVSA